MTMGKVYPAKMWVVEKNSPVKRAVQFGEMSMYITEVMVDKITKRSVIGKIKPDGDVRRMFNFEVYDAFENYDQALDALLEQIEFRDAQLTSTYRKLQALKREVMKERSK